MILVHPTDESNFWFIISYVLRNAMLQFFQLRTIWTPVQTHLALVGLSLQRAPEIENGRRTDQPLIKRQIEALTSKKGTCQHPTLHSSFQIPCLSFLNPFPKTPKSLNPQFNYLFPPQNWLPFRIARLFNTYRAPQHPLKWAPRSSSWQSSWHQSHSFFSTSQLTSHSQHQHPKTTRNWSKPQTQSNIQWHLHTWSRHQREMLPSWREHCWLYTTLEITTWSTLILALWNQSIWLWLILWQRSLFLVKWAMFGLWESKILLPTEVLPCLLPPCMLCPFSWRLAPGIGLSTSVPLITL